MKKTFITLFIILVFSTFSFGKFDRAPLEKRVESSDLIVTGSLQSVSEYETDEFEHSKGNLVIDQVVWGDFTTREGNLLKSKDQLEIGWRNSKLIACRISFPENEKGIWLLRLADDGTIEPLFVGSMEPLGGFAELEILLKNKQNFDKKPKVIKLFSKHNVEQDSDVLFCDFDQQVQENEKEDHSPFSAFLVILVSLLLYKLLYRSKFKIR